MPNGLQKNVAASQAFSISGIWIRHQDDMKAFPPVFLELCVKWPKSTRSQRKGKLRREFKTYQLRASLFQQVQVSFWPPFICCIWRNYVKGGQFWVVEAGTFFSLVDRLNLQSDFFWKYLGLRKYSPGFRGLASSSWNHNLSKLFRQTEMLLKMSCLQQFNIWGGALNGP